MKILQFPTRTDDLLEFLDRVKEECKTHGIDNFLCCFKDKKNKQVCTGYFDVDLGERQELIGHLQADVIEKRIFQSIEDIEGED